MTTLFHSQTGTAITALPVVTPTQLNDLRKLLPEDQRYKIKQVVFCLDANLDQLAQVFELFGDILASGISPADVAKALLHATEGRLSHKVKVLNVREVPTKGSGLLNMHVRPHGRGKPSGRIIDVVDNKVAQVQWTTGRMTEVPIGDVVDPKKYHLSPAANRS